MSRLLLLLLLLSTKRYNCLPSRRPKSYHLFIYIFGTVFQELVGIGRSVFTKMTTKAIRGRDIPSKIFPNLRCRTGTYCQDIASECVHLIMPGKLLKIIFQSKSRTEFNICIQHLHSTSAFNTIFYLLHLRPATRTFIYAHMPACAPSFLILV